jgi:hypothetical protein
MGWIVFTMKVILAGTVFAVALSARRSSCVCHRPIAIQLGVSVNFRTGTVAGDSRESTWLDPQAKKRAFNGSSRLRDEGPGSAQIALHLDRIGEIEEGVVYAETKIEELLERKLRFDKPVRTRSTPYR